MDGGRVEEKSVLGSPQQRTLVPRESRFNKGHIHEMVGRHDEAGKTLRDLWRCEARALGESWKSRRGIIQRLLISSSGAGGVFCHH